MFGLSVCLTGMRDHGVLGFTYENTSERCWQAGCQLFSVIWEIAEDRKGERNGEPESWSAPVRLQSFQTSVLAVVIVLIKDKSTSSKVDCTSEGLLLSLMELAWIRLYPCCLGLLHCNMEFSLSGAVSQLWDRVLCFLVFQFRESEIVITEIEMVINYKYLLSVQDLVEQCCFAFSKLYLNQPLNRMDWLLQDGLSRNWTKLAVWVVLGKSATNYKEMFFIIKYFFNHFSRSRASHRSWDRERR